MEEEEREEQTPPGTPFDYGLAQTAARDSAAAPIPTANFFTPLLTDSQATWGSYRTAAGTGRRSPSPIRTRNEAIQARRLAEEIPANPPKAAPTAATTTNTAGTAIAATPKGPRDTESLRLRQERKEQRKLLPLLRHVPPL